MADTLISPGVKVSITDESLYASPGTGTVPLIVLATRENKVDPTGTYADGIAILTKKQNANAVSLVTSQRELTQFYGNVVFRKVGNTIVEGDETHEYGLLTAYSYLGQGSRAFVVRADVDLGQLEPNSSVPAGIVPFGTFWLDTANSIYGIHTYSNNRWNPVTPIVVVKSAIITSVSSVPVQIDQFLVFIDGKTLTYYKGIAVIEDDEEIPTWIRLDGDYVENGLTYAEHYNSPENPVNDDIWIKITSPSNGLNLKIYSANFQGLFNQVAVQGVSLNLNSEIYVDQSGLTLTQYTANATDPDNRLINGQLQLFRFEVVEDTVVTSSGIEIVITVNGDTETITNTFVASSLQPIGEPNDDALWFDPDLLDLDILIKASAGWSRIPKTNIIYNVSQPVLRSDGNPLQANDVWVDLSAPESEYPKLYRFVSSQWIAHTNTDQTTEYGVVFADITTNSQLSTSPTPGVISSGNLIEGSPVAALYPNGILAINMCNSANTVRRYNGTTGVWRNAAPNNFNGSGCFGRLAQRKIIATAMQAAVSGNELLGEEIRNFTLMCAPNFPELYDEFVTLNINRGETAFIIVDAPMRKNPNEVVSWVLNTNAGENGEDGLTNKYTYSAVYYPSVRTTTPSGDTVTAPASHSILYQFAYNDSIAYPWFAAAGLTRGVVGNASNVGYIDREGEFRPVALSNNQRDSLYERKINPIANFPGEGVVVFGNKSLHQFTSALDRVNVGRLVAYLRERFAEIGRPFLFEQNDQATRELVKAAYETFLFDIVSKRGITDFVVVSDFSNNTPLRIDRNELWVDIAIVPTKSIEFIYIPIRLVNTGEI